MISDKPIIMPVDYEKYVLEKLPPTAYYIPNFISDDEEQHIVKNIYSVPKPKWTHLSNRRLQDYGGVPHKNGMIVEKIPDWLKKYMEKIKELNVYPEDRLPNHVLINEYLSGQGIMPHTDGPLFYPTITTISCSSHTVLELRKNQNEIVDNIEYKIILEPRSLLILKNDLYNSYLHSIKEITSDIVDDNFVNLQNCYKSYNIGDNLERDTRISVTIRNVPKVAKIKLW